MKPNTFKEINKVLAKHGYELHKGGGYFYFTPLPPFDKPQFRDSMVCVNKLSQLTLGQWEKELLDKIEEENRFRGEEEAAFDPTGEKYKNKLPYPSQKYRYIIYSFGEKILDTTDEEEYKRERIKYPGAPVEKFKTSEEEYKQKMIEYRQETARLQDQFVQELYKYYEVEDNPKRDLCYSKAWDHGHSAGLSEVASVFGDLVELIK